MTKQYILYVRNEAQKILMDKELKGQLSDGAWENDDTDQRLWFCDVRIAHNGDRLGCNWKVKHPVNFDDSELDFLWDRMVDYVKERYTIYTVDHLREDLQDLTEVVFGGGVEE